MNPIDFLVLAVIAAILGAAALCIYRCKKRGRRCIGCPGSGGCSGSCACCGRK